MCGIAGICNLNGKPIDSKLLKKMTNALRHRGPDDEGLYINNGGDCDMKVGLGHRRLKVIDLSKKAHQPMCNEDKSIWIIFNGEIYNFGELRIELEKKGHKFQSHSDTETIIHLYEEMDIDCVKKLGGMFAFAIWDANKSRLFLARDRVGKKPLNYLCNSNTFLFGSEIKAILQDEKIEREVDVESMHYYLTYGYSPSPRTMFKGIKKLPPAHILTLDKNGIRIEKYWSLNYARKRILPLNEYIDRTLELLREAVKIRLVSDVPLGAFLSGGIDSSAVVALMSEFSLKPVKTFTIGFQDEDYSEIKYARIIAKRFNTDHHEIFVKPDAMKILPKLIWLYNEPYGDSSCIPTYYVSEATRRYVTVALNGDGGDESFAGYIRYKGMKLAEAMGNIPHFLLMPLVQAIKVLRSIKRFKERSLLDYMNNFLQTMVEYPDYHKRYVRWISYFTDEDKEKLYSRELLDVVGNINSYSFLTNIIENSTAKDILDKILNTDVLSYLPEDLLVKMDIASMGNSLEARSPLLDHNLMEWAASIPVNFKLSGFTNKFVFKRTLSKILPRGILQRKKMGFAVPIGRWFRNELKGFVYEVLLDNNGINMDFFNKDYIDRLLNEHISGKANHQFRIWALLNFELWHKMFINDKSFEFYE
jgi:asparagine synthase (glutamine-hydrolysing)